MDPNACHVPPVSETIMLLNQMLDARAAGVVDHDNV